MAMTPFPVVIPFQVRGPGHDIPTLSIQAAASTARNAIAVANAFVELMCLRRTQTRPSKVHVERARLGPAGPAIVGPYAYVIGHTNHIPLVPFPQRLDQQSTQSLRLTMQGLSAGGADTMIVDAAQLTFLDSSAISALSTLSGIASDSPGIQLRLFRPSTPIRKVFEIVGLDRVLGIHDTLIQAIAATANKWQSGSTRHG